MRETPHNQLDESCGTTNWYYELVLRIVINRIRGITLDEIAPVQYGFMQDKRTGNAIFVLRRLVERSVEKQICIRLFH